MNDDDGDESDDAAGFSSGMILMMTCMSCSLKTCQMNGWSHAELILVPILTNLNAFIEKLTGYKKDS